jgi:hypothetical protein
MSDEAALAKEMSPGAEPPRAAASSVDDAAVAVAAAPDPASDAVVAGTRDPEKAGEDEQGDPTGVGEKKPPLPADEPASTERSLDEKTMGDADAVVAAAPSPPPPAEDGGKDGAAANGKDEDDEANAQYLVGLPRLLLGFGLCVTTFLIGLDQVRTFPRVTCFVLIEDWQMIIATVCAVGLHRRQERSCRRRLSPKSWTSSTASRTSGGTARRTS